MRSFSKIADLRKFLRQFKLREKSIGLVPTMGALHEGHLQLIKASLNENDLTVCSIFVNPTQFNNPDDLKNYPRDTKSDLSKLTSIGCEAVFNPSAGEMYGVDNPLVNFSFGYLEEIMEGKYRPGHFKGVGLIISKLFNVVAPSRAYFGSKDLQQLAIIKLLVNELRFNIAIVPVETVREHDGLAMSSRNNLLTQKDRASANHLFKALTTAKTKLKSGESVKSVKNYVRDFFNTRSPAELEYFEIVRTKDLKDITEINGSENVSLCIAGYLGKVRLIDNLSLF